MYNIFLNWFYLFVSADGLMDNLRWIADNLNSSSNIRNINSWNGSEEFIVSIISAINGLKYVSLGNVIGNSVMANTLCFSLPFLLFPQQFLSSLSQKIKN